MNIQLMPKMTEILKWITRKGEKKHVEQFTRQSPRSKKYLNDLFSIKLQLF